MESKGGKLLQAGLWPNKINKVTRQPLFSGQEMAVLAYKLDLRSIVFFYLIYENKKREDFSLHTSWWLLQLSFNILIVIFFLMTFLHLRRNRPGKPYFQKTLQILESKIAVLEDLFGKTDGQLKKSRLMVDKKEEKLKQWVHQAEHQLVLFNEAIKSARQLKEKLLSLQAQMQAQVQQALFQQPQVPPQTQAQVPPQTQAQAQAPMGAQGPNNPHPSQAAQPSFHLNHLNDTESVSPYSQHKKPAPTRKLKQIFRHPNPSGYHSNRNVEE